MKTRVLVVVDMQNDFIDGSLGTKEAALIVFNVKKKIEEWEGKVIFTRDTHQENYLDTQEGINLPIMHCIENTEGWQISKLLDTNKAIEIFNKNTFGSIDLGKWLKRNEKDLEEVQFVGLCTDICVLSNAILVKAFLPECLISVDARCCAGVTVQSHEIALKAMEACQIKVIR